MEIFPGEHRIGFGAAPIGNLFTEVSDADAAAAVEAAWDAGWRYYDVAPHYGLGLAERRLGEVLRTKPRDSYVLSTKVGRLLVDGGTPKTDDEGYAVTTDIRRQWDFSRDGILRSIEDSLHRMGTDRIDIAYVHDPDDHFEPALSTAFPALVELRDQRVVRAIGAGMNQSEMLTEFVKRADLDVIMLAGRYSVLDEGALDNVLPACVENKVQVVAVGVFNSGLLSRPRPKPGATFNYEPADAGLVDAANKIADIAEAHGVTLPAVALQFPLGHPAVAGVAVGCRTADQVRGNAELWQTEVPAGVWDDLRSAGLLRPDAPTP